ncbi:MAG: DUF3795 domain-containing protein [Tannerella sp.]|nr:DUF3795 domain-containing protein [Tannerella sp.]
MNKKVLTAPCGLDCFNCPLYKGNITEEYKKQVSEFLGIPLEETPCEGCRDEKGHCKFATGEHCITWDCVQEKGVTYCYECADFPCKLLMPSQKGAQFPHNMKVYNLCRMKFFGIEKWIEEAAEIRERYFTGTFEVGKGPVLENDNS